MKKTYAAPEIEVVEVQIEAGFAATGTGSFGDNPPTIDPIQSW